MISEEQTGKLVREAQKSPSPFFTDKIMTEVSAEKAVVRKPKLKLYLYAAGCLIIFALSVVIELPEMSFMHTQIHFSSYVLPLFSTILLFVAIWQIAESASLLEHNQVS